MPRPVSVTYRVWPTSAEVAAGAAELFTSAVAAATVRHAWCRHSADGCRPSHPSGGCLPPPSWERAQSVEREYSFRHKVDAFFDHVWIVHRQGVDRSPAVQPGTAPCGPGTDPGRRMHHEPRGSATAVLIRLAGRPRFTKASWQLSAAQSRRSRRSPPHPAWGRSRRRCGAAG